MKRYFSYTLVLVFLALVNFAKAGNPTLKDCKVMLKNDTLTIENECMCRTYVWNNGDIRTISIRNKSAAFSWLLKNKEGDSFFPGENSASNAHLTVKKIAANSITPDYLQAEIITCLGSFFVKKVFRIYPDCPAFACDIYLKGSTNISWLNRVGNNGDLINIETQSAISAGQVKVTTMEKLNLDGRNWKVKAVRFYDITDRNNNLVSENTQLVYRGESRLQGNLLFINSQLNKNGLFLLKEAPTAEAQINYPGFDFTAGVGEIAMAGVGIDSKELQLDSWTRCYGFVTGVYAGGEYEQLAALRNYQQHIRTHQINRDEMILLNTWGDRNQDKSVNEKFVLNEIRDGEKLGITHFQIDDGWQAGKSGNSAFAGGSFNNIWDNPDYWTPDKNKFPQGLGPIIQAGKKANIEICLWFNPSKDHDYESWLKDAGALIKLYRDYGIRTFKIDGVQVSNKQCEINLRKMLDTVLKATDNKAVFNLDVTAGKRYGYHFFNEYGNVFLENRYTDFGNYYPHWTLRNLWMLSKYVPAQNLQIEFLNNARNKQNYKDDPLAPSNLSFEYLFATTIMAQPLAWFEASGLPKAFFNIAPVVKKYHSWQAAIHRGQIFPIGNEPDGTTWTGFQSIQKGKGFVVVYRENNKQSAISMPTWFAKGTTVSFKPILGDGKPFRATAGENGRIVFSLSHPNTYALYEYVML